MYDQLTRSPQNCTKQNQAHLKRLSTLILFTKNINLLSSESLQFHTGSYISSSHKKPSIYAIESMYVTFADLAHMIVNAVVHSVIFDEAVRTGSTIVGFTRYLLNLKIRSKT